MLKLAWESWEDFFFARINLIIDALYNISHFFGCKIGVFNRPSKNHSFRSTHFHRVTGVPLTKLSSWIFVRGEQMNNDKTMNANEKSVKIWKVIN